MNGAFYWLIAQRVTRGWTWRKRIAVILLVGPVLMGIAAAGAAVVSVLTLTQSERVEGTVVDRYEWPGETIFDRGQINYEPIFTYIDPATGTERRASVGTPHTSFDFEIGETTEILVKPGSTGNVTLPGDGLWFLPKVLALIGLAWLAVSLAILLLLRVTVWRERTAT